jgi:hypothetical protein
MNFKDTIIPKNTIFYRAVRKRRFLYQNPIQLKIPEGRFNTKHQYCFYLGYSEESAIMEHISRTKSRLKKVILHKYCLTEDVNVVDLIRWSYPFPSKGDYPNEQIMINQHITCPKRKFTTWLYNQTQVIADYFRQDTQKMGIRYQTSIAHSIKHPENYGTPDNLFVVAFFVDPKMACRLFKYCRSYKRKISKYYKYAKIKFDNSTVENAIRVKDSREQVGGVKLHREEIRSSLGLLEFH